MKNGQCMTYRYFFEKIKKGLELYASGIYPRIFTGIDSLYKAGEGTLGFLRKFDGTAYLYDDL